MKCPFDKKCKDCKFNTKMFSTLNSETTEVYKCAISWLPILLSEIKTEITDLKKNNDKEK